MSWLLALWPGCVPVVDHVVRERDDYSYATGDVWRVDDDACGQPGATTASGGAIVIVWNRTDEEVALEVVDQGCTPTDWGTLPPGDEIDVGVPEHDVLRVFDAAGELRSAWELPFVNGAGGTVVLRW